MKLGDIFTIANSESVGLKNERVADEKSSHNIELNLTIQGLSSDSRNIRPGYVFFALPGDKTNGVEFIDQAIGQGACAIVVTKNCLDKRYSIPVIEVANPRFLLAKSAAIFYGRQPELMIAVTGTSGKTSVASFVHQIWTLAGKRAAMVGTTGIISPLGQQYGTLTTPDPVALHTLLREFSDDNITHCSMEASSHGLDQYRLDGVMLSAGAFTNLGRDHMDYHATVDHYFDAKMALFERVLPKGSPAIIFADDEWSDQAIKRAQGAGMNVLTVGRKGKYLTLKRVEQHRYHQRAEIHFNGDIFEIDLPLAGDFQMSNALIAAGLCLATGSDSKMVMAALEKFKGARGRLDFVGTSKSGAMIYVDYAHKPDALENVLKSVRPFTTGRLVLTFGCGGDRDKGKRAIMGEIASRLADVVIITDDNPRSEEAKTIRAEILATAPEALEIGDRREAIRQAINSLKAGDTLIIAGKGHEQGQIIGDQTLPFSDHDEVHMRLEEWA